MDKCTEAVCFLRIGVKLLGFGDDSTQSSYFKISLFGGGWKALTMFLLNETFILKVSAGSGPVWVPTLRYRWFLNFPVRSPVLLDLRGSVADVRPPACRLRTPRCRFGLRDRIGSVIPGFRAGTDGGGIFSDYNREEPEMFRFKPNPRVQVCDLSELWPSDPNRSGPEPAPRSDL